MPSSVTNIGEAVFAGCYSLESITVDSGNTVYHSAGNCIIDTANKILVAGCKNSVIPNDGSVTSIGEFAFLGCYKLVEVCNLSNLKFTIGSQDHGCVAEAAKYVYTTSNYQSKLSTTDDGFIVYADSYENEYYLMGYIDDQTKITLPQNINGHNYDIDIYALIGCYSLTEVTIPNSVTYIDQAAFALCSSLTSITIPASITSIGDSAFDFCSSLETVYYTGSQEQWEQIKISSNNDNLLDANIIFNA